MSLIAGFCSGKYISLKRLFKNYLFFIPSIFSRKRNLGNLVHCSGFVESNRISYGLNFAAQAIKNSQVVVYIDIKHDPYILKQLVKISSNYDNKKILLKSGFFSDSQFDLANVFYYRFSPQFNDGKSVSFEYFKDCIKNIFSGLPTNSVVIVNGIGDAYGTPSLVSFLGNAKKMCVHKRTTLVMSDSKCDKELFDTVIDLNGSVIFLDLYNRLSSISFPLISKLIGSNYSKGLLFIGSKIESIKLFNEIRINQNKLNGKKTTVLKIDGCTSMINIEDAIIKK